MPTFSATVKDTGSTWSIGYDDVKPLQYNAPKYTLGPHDRRTLAGCVKNDTTAEHEDEFCALEFSQTLAGIVSVEELAFSCTQLDPDNDPPKCHQPPSALTFDIDGEAVADTVALALPTTEVDATPPKQPWPSVNATRESDNDTHASSDGRTYKPDEVAFAEDTFHNTVTRQV